MQAIKNEVVDIEELEVTGYRCKFCGALNSGMADYSEVGYGTASLKNLDGELEDPETNDYDNFQISGYRCIECNEDEHRIDDIFEPIYDREREE